MMMPAADEDDDFIVQTVVERGASDAPEDGALGWGLRKLGGFVFAKTDPSDRSNAVEPEPTLPPGFSATLNAEEEEIYPAETKIKVLVAEGNLGGRGRRQAAELHQALQQVVGAAAIYKHLLVKHGVVSAKRTGAGSDGAEGGGSGAICGCGGAVGSCKAISALLKEELEKVKKDAETDRRGALLKKFRQVERRSGGLCNPDLLEKVVRSSSTDAKTPPKMPPPHEESPRRSSFPPPGGGTPTATAGKNGMAPVSITSSPYGPGGTTASSGFSTSSGGHYEGSGNSQNIPWADDMLCGATRFRHGAMLKSRGRMLAKSLARLLRGVSSDLQGVASRLPPWQEDKVEIEAITREESSHCRSQSRSSFTSVDTADDSSEKLSDAKAPATTPTPSVTSVSSTDDGTDVKARRQDWKLDAQELSLIRREEERVLKPDVLARLLAAGAGLGCLQQADFWDVFARLEVATRTEALLNIAIRGGRGCPARAGRMGRELCISLTAVVLEAINTVEQAQHTQSGQRPLQLNDPNDQSIQQQQPQTRAQPQPQRAATAEKRRPSSERFSRGAIAAESLKVGARARSGSESNGKPHSRRAGAGAVTAEGTFHKEDPGLKDLDKREEEFRKAIYVNRSALANRLLQLTHDAPLCAKVLGTFVNDAGNAGQGLENRPWTTGRADASAPFSSPMPQPPGAQGREGSWESLPGGCKGEARSGNAASNGFDRRESRKSSESQPSPPLSMASTDPLSEGVDDTAAWDQPPPSGEKGGGATAAARSQMASYSQQTAPDSSKDTSTYLESCESDALLSSDRPGDVAPTGYPLAL